ncbi:MAG: glycerate kinase [Calditrichaeota bacterium]|nr:glycerate kinase [Calditrichota bacterium]
MTPLREQAERIVLQAIEAVKPWPLIHSRVHVQGNVLQIDRHRWDLSAFDNLWVIGFGKASAYMAQALEDLLGERITGGMVIVKYGHAAGCRRVRIREAGHPVLDEQGLAATQELLQLVRQAGEQDLVLCLISGGGSALLESPPAGIHLDDLQQTFRLLLESGATIEEMNAVRKHLSRVKGGQLAREIYPATCVSLIISDVIGDPLDAIASGPTAPDRTTFQDAWRVINKYGLVDRLPASVRTYLQRGISGNEPETVSETDPLWQRVTNIVIGNNRLALQRAAEVARQLGYQPFLLTSRVQGEAREVARVLAAIIQEIQTTDQPVRRPACLLVGGETTVQVTGSGKGGRNQELALALLLAMGKQALPYAFVSCGTDGTDGPTDAAGGWADPSCWTAIEDRGLDPLPFLINNDAYPFLETIGGLLKTGPTGTNVMDIMVGLIP